MCISAVPHFCVIAVNVKARVGRLIVSYQLTSHAVTHMWVHVRLSTVYNCKYSGRLEDIPEKTLDFLALTQISALCPIEKVILRRSSLAQHEAGIICQPKVKNVRCLWEIHLLQKDAKPSKQISENYLSTPIPPSKMSSLWIWMWMSRIVV